MRIRQMRPLLAIKSSLVSKVRVATLVMFLGLFFSAVVSAQFGTPGLNTANLIPVSHSVCKVQCDSVDAIVFVHGIFGDKETFTNKRTQFSWPEALEKSLGDEQVDVFRLDYLTSLISWAEGSTTDLETLTSDIFHSLEPLRDANYRSIGFIAHSLGGNVVATYIVRSKLRLGRDFAFQNAYTIMLGTPTSGSDWADIGSSLKKFLRMDDGLLMSLSADNTTFLDMLKTFRQDVDDEGQYWGCRSTHLHAAFEQRHKYAVIRLFDRVQAAKKVTAASDSPIRFFDASHSAIAKPKDVDDEIYRWVLEIVRAEIARIKSWEAMSERINSRTPFCVR